MFITFIFTNKHTEPPVLLLLLPQILRGKEDSLTGFLDPMNFGDGL